MESTKTCNHQILVVDNHGVNQQLAVMLIERLGYRTNVAANGQKAVDACTTIPHSLVFMDGPIPVLDGYDDTKNIRKVEMEEVRSLDSERKDTPS